MRRQRRTSGIRTSVVFGSTGCRWSGGSAVAGASRISAGRRSKYTRLRTYRCVGRLGAAEPWPWHGVESRARWRARSRRTSASAKGSCSAGCHLSARVRFRDVAGARELKEQREENRSASVVSFHCPMKGAVSPSPHVRKYRARAVFQESQITHRRGSRAQQGHVHGSPWLPHADGGSGLWRHARAIFPPLGAKMPSMLAGGKAQAHNM